MKTSLFRQKSLEKISSPENLDEYLHVTNPSVWLILTSVLLLLIGMLYWSSVTDINSLARGNARVTNGSMCIYFENSKIADNVESGMTVKAGETESRISSIGTDEKGELFAEAPTKLPDGDYQVEVVFKQTKVLNLLFN